MHLRAPFVFNVFVLLLATLAGSPAGAAETAALNFRPPQRGDSWAFHSTWTETLGPPDGSPARITVQRRTGRVEVLDPETRKLRLTIERECTDEITVDGRTTAAAAALAGKTITLWADHTQPSEVETDLRPGPSPKLREELSRYLQPELYVYPNKEVAVGSAWKTRPPSVAWESERAAWELEALDDQAPQSKPPSSTVQSTLARIDSTGGRNVAVIDVAGNFECHAVSGSVTATYRVDIETGQLLARDTEITEIQSGEAARQRRTVRLAYAVGAPGASDTATPRPRAAAAPPVTQPAGKVEIRPNFAGSEMWRLVCMSRSDTVAGDRVVPNAQSWRMHRQGVLRLKGVAKGVPTQLWLGLVPQESIDKQADADPAAPPMRPYPGAGKIFRELVRGANGGMVAEQPVPQEIAGDLEAFWFDQTSYPYPGRAVAIGEEWSADHARLFFKLLDVRAGDTASFRCVLRGVGKVGEIRTADVMIKGTIDRTNRSGPEADMSVAGIIRFELSTGRPYETSLVARYFPAGRRRPMAEDTEARRQFEYSQIVYKQGEPIQRWTVADVAGGEVPGAGDARGADAVEEPQAAFIGKFSGEGVSLELASSDNGITGSLTRGALRFPVTASIRDGRLVGHFTHGGDRFPFTAAVEGGRMSFDSDGNLYTLQKTTAKNPLAKPGNPLLKE